MAATHYRKVLVKRYNENRFFAFILAFYIDVVSAPEAIFKAPRALMRDNYGMLEIYA